MAKAYGYHLIREYGYLIVVLNGKMQGKQSLVMDRVMMDNDNCHG